MYITCLYYIHNVHMYYAYVYGMLAGLYVMAMIQKTDYYHHAFVKPNL
jgi:hypothetical protein